MLNQDKLLFDANEKLVNHILDEYELLSGEALYRAYFEYKISPYFETAWEREKRQAALEAGEPDTEYSNDFTYYEARATKDLKYHHKSLRYFTKCYPRAFAIPAELQAEKSKQLAEAKAAYESAYELVEKLAERLGAKNQDELEQLIRLEHYEELKPYAEAYASWQVLQDEADCAAAAEELELEQLKKAPFSFGRPTKNYPFNL